MNKLIYENNKKFEDKFLECYYAVVSTVKDIADSKTMQFPILSENDVHFGFQRYLYDEDFAPSIDILTIPKNRVTERKMNESFEKMRKALCESQSYGCKYKDETLDSMMVTRNLLKEDNAYSLEMISDSENYTIRLQMESYLKSYKDDCKKLVNESILITNKELFNLDEDLFGFARNKYNQSINALHYRLHADGIYVFNLYEIFDGSYLDLFKRRFDAVSRFKPEEIYCYYKKPYEQDVEIGFEKEFILNKKYGKLFEDKDTVLGISYLECKGNYYPIIGIFNTKYKRIVSIFSMALSYDESQKIYTFYFTELYSADYNFLKTQAESARKQFRAIHF